MSIFLGCDPHVLRNTTTHMASLVHCRHAPLSFESILPGSADVRVAEGIPPLIWAVDLAVAVSGGTRGNASRDLRDIPETLFPKHNLIRKSMPGKGNGNALLVTFEHAIELMMVLPGKMAKEFRIKACDVLKRYIAGDASLHAEVEANAASSSHINVLAREAIAGEAAAKLPVDSRDIERSITGVKRLRVEIDQTDLKKITEIYELERRREEERRKTEEERRKTEEERRKTLALEIMFLDRRDAVGETFAGKARLEAASDARAETYKDADLRRLEQRLTIEARFKAGEAAMSMDVDRAVPTGPAKTVQELARMMPDWEALGVDERVILVSTVGRAIARPPHNIPFMPEKKDEASPAGSAFQVNQFEHPYHSQITLALQAQLAKMRREARPAPHSSQRTLSACWS